MCERYFCTGLLDYNYSTGFSSEIMYMEFCTIASFLCAFESA